VIPLVVVQLVEISGELGRPYLRLWLNPEMPAPNNISSVAALSPDASIQALCWPRRQQNVGPA
jgi:hypothetical protein